MPEPGDSSIEYRLTTGERGRVEVKSVVRVSVLGDGRGVIYTADGTILVVQDGKRFSQRWREHGVG